MKLQELRKRCAQDGPAPRSAVLGVDGVRGLEIVLITDLISYIISKCRPIKPLLFASRIHIKSVNLNCVN